MATHLTAAAVPRRPLLVIVVISGISYQNLDFAMFLIVIRPRGIFDNVLGLEAVAGSQDVILPLSRLRSEHTCSEFDY